MSPSTVAALNQAGLVLGFVGAILLAVSTKVGVISKNGSITFTGLDPFDPVEKNLRIVRTSHWRNRYFTPLGWALIAAAFFLQLVATL